MSSFAVQLQQFAEKAEHNANDVVGRVISAIATELDERSPVGDATYWQNPPPKGYVGGRFRGNWQLGINVIPQGETGRIDPGGGETLSTIIASIPAQPAGTIAYMVNNVPYGPALEDGHSRQAPQGLVGLTSMGWQAKVDQAAEGVGG